MLRAIPISIRHRLEAWPLIGLFKLFSLLSVDLASAVAGKLVRYIGPLLGRNRRAEDNLKHVMPDLSRNERRQILRGMWENIGRIFGEFPHMAEILNDPERFRFEGIEECLSHIKAGSGAVAIAGHFGNWELSPAPSYRLGRRQVNFYRKINNPVLDNYVLKQRRKIVTGVLIAKGDDSFRWATATIRRGDFIGFFADQRESEGILAPFLGIEVPTNHAPAILAMRYGVPILMGKVIREGGVKFRMECQNVTVASTGNKKSDILATTTRINDVFGQWIRAHPDQWLWLHSRWRGAMIGDTSMTAADGLEAGR